MSATERLLSRREDLGRVEASHVSFWDLLTTPWGFLVTLFVFGLPALAVALGWL